MSGCGLYTGVPNRLKITVCMLVYVHLGYHWPFVCQLPHAQSLLSQPYSQVWWKNFTFRQLQHQQQQQQPDNHLYWESIHNVPMYSFSALTVHLIGLVVQASASGAKDSGFESRLRQDFSRSSHTSDFKICTPVATLPGAWHYRVNTGTGRLCINILWLGEVESLICNFFLSVAARNIVCADPSLRYTSLLLGR